MEAVGGHGSGVMSIKNTIRKKYTVCFYNTARLY